MALPPRRLRLHALATSMSILLGACGGSGDGHEPDPPPTAEAVADPPPPAEEVVADPPEAPTPIEEPATSAGPAVRGGNIEHIDSRGRTQRALMLREADLPRPDGPVIGRIEVHAGSLAVRSFGEVEVPYPEVIVIHDGALCRSPIARARRLHTTFVSSYDAYDEVDERTYTALDLADCERGMTGVVGIGADQVRVRSLRPEDVETPASPELVEAVRHVDDGVWGGPPLPAGRFRALPLPARGVTVVLGTAAWVVRDGVVLSGGTPTVLIEAGPLALFEVQSPSEDWTMSLAEFTPSYVPTRCEVIDDSGSPLNVRAGPRRHAPVVNQLTRGTVARANDGWGEWFHLNTDPPGWAHRSGLRCGELRHVGSDESADGEIPAPD